MMDMKTFEPGCYIDSHLGHYAIPAAIRFAVEQGYILDPFEKYALDRYDAANHTDEYPGEALIELSDEVIDWLNHGGKTGQNEPPAITDDVYWGWEDGDFGLWSSSTVSYEPEA